MKPWFSVFAASALAVAAAHAGLDHDTHPAEAVSALPEVSDAPALLPGAVSVKPGDVIPGAPTCQPPRRRIFAFGALGGGNGKMLVATIGAGVHFDSQWNLRRHGRISPYGELVWSYWQGNYGETGVRSLQETGGTFFLRARFLRTPDSIVHPYVDIGAGLHYLTNDRIEDRRLGRHWQAGSNIGVGFILGRDERVEIGVRMRHLSNAGTDVLNIGADQILGRLAFRF